MNLNINLILSDPGGAPDRMLNIDAKADNGVVSGELRWADKIDKDRRFSITSERIMSLMNRKTPDAQEILEIFAAVVGSLTSHLQAQKDFKVSDLKYGLNVADLTRMLDQNDLPDDTPVFVERIQDVYFFAFNWGTMKAENHDIPGEKDELIPAHWACIKKDSEGREAVAIWCRY